MWFTEIKLKINCVKTRMNILAYEMYVKNLDHMPEKNAKAHQEWEKWYKFGPGFERYREREPKKFSRKSD